MKKIHILFILTLFLSACSSKPSDVSQEIWDQSIQYTIYIDKTTKENKEKHEDFNDTLLSFISDSKETDLTEKEEKIIENIQLLNIESLGINLIQLFSEPTEDDFKEYEKYYSELEKILGKTNLRHSNLDTEVLAKYISKQAIANTAQNENLKEDFMKQNNINLTADEVRYNMPNNLDEPFFIEGEVELCDYYNYGYTNEEKFFCGNLTPSDGGYTDSWYLYFHRESFNALYNRLLSGGTENIMVSAEISSSAYKKGQGNMARVKGLKWK